MLVFISDYPNQQNEKDGMIQRIAAIDKIFCNSKRMYLDIHIHPFLHLFPSRIKHNDDLTVWKINIIWLLFFIPNILLSKMVYVHSIYNAYKILFLYKFIGNKIITDMHGVVPEELAFLGYEKLAKQYNITEESVLRNSHSIVTVTDSMKQHFCNKYKNIQIESINLPIFDNENYKLEQMTPMGNKTHTILYSGGSQKWQNLDSMLEFASRFVEEFNFIFLTGDIEIFTKKLSAYSLNDKVELKSVNKDKVYEEYKKADFGFVLRDDNTVNRVSCPTKLIEYLASGLIPIVLQPEIGDFNKLGYKYLLLDELSKGNIPEKNKIEEMRRHNLLVLETLQQDVTRATQDLYTIMTA
jgi:hypothetical protein